MLGVSGAVEAQLSPSVRLSAIIAVRVECRKQTPFPLFFLWFFFVFFFSMGVLLRQRWVDAVGCCRRLFKGPLPLDRIRQPSFALLQPGVCGINESTKTRKKRQAL